MCAYVCVRMCVCVCIRVRARSLADLRIARFVGKGALTSAREIAALTSALEFRS